MRALITSSLKNSSKLIFFFVDFGTELMLKFLYNII